MDIFYDKKATIYSVSYIEKDYTSVKEKTILYDNITCDYFIATRWNVVNRQPDLGNRQQDLERIDLIIPPEVYDVNKPIEQGMYVDTNEWDSYIIDQLEYYYMPSWELESVYLRLNQKWK